jgi:hypothetical protein
MNDDQLREADARFRHQGELSSPLLAEFESTVAALVRYGRLPASLSPYGAWNDEAAKEVLQGWLEGKLLRGDLLALLDRAGTAGAFRRMAERSLRHWLLNQRERSQARNLYARAVELLRDGDEFVIREDAARPQDVWWTLRDRPDASPHPGDERSLAAAAWSLGDFALVRYSSEQSKTSPLLSTTDLKRFIRGMMEATQSALTPALLMRALAARFNLGAVQLAEPEAAVSIASDEGVAEEAVLRDAARTVIAELTLRQLDVLLGTRAGETLEAMAERNRCSVGTIHNEQRRIADVVRRYGENSAEEEQLLKMTGDLLYEAGS